MSNHKKKEVTLDDLMVALVGVKGDVFGLKQDVNKIIVRLIDHEARMDTFATRDDMVKFKDDIIGHIDELNGAHKTFHIELGAMSSGNKRRDKRLDRLDKQSGFGPIA